jgi:predicted MFS family arabinose efflux permease
MPVERDLRLILAVQALRAFAYGFGSVILGTALGASGLSNLQVGLVFTAMLAGMAVSSVVVGLLGDRTGRRRTYVVLLVLMGLTGAVFALTRFVPLLVLAALTGTLSTDPNESGPITSLEQAMMASAPRDLRSRVFGRYNAVAYLSGAVGALAAGGSAAVRGTSATTADQRWLLVFVPIAIACAVLGARLSPATEAARPEGAARRAPLDRSRPIVLRLAALFGLDSFAGGFVVQTFLVYWFERRFGASPEAMGVTFFAAGLLQAGSSVIAGRLAMRLGLLNTMVFTHLPSNILLILVPLMPNLPLAITLLLLRFTLSQMDVPARQAYVVTMVEPEERTAASAFTNTARYVTRPAGPLVGGALMRLAIGAPFVVAGALKIVYDLALFATFRRVAEPPPEEPAATAGK